MKVFVSMKYFLDFLVVKLPKIAISASTKRTKINQYEPKLTKINQNQPNEPK